MSKEFEEAYKKANDTLKRVNDLLEENIKRKIMLDTFDFIMNDERIEQEIDDLVAFNIEIQEMIGKK